MKYELNLSHLNRELLFSLHIYITPHLVGIKLMGYTIIGIYRSFLAEESFACQLEDVMDLGAFNNLYLCGDFNLDYGRMSDPQYNRRRLAVQLGDLTNELNMVQLIDRYTWHRWIEGALITSTLDHLYTNSRDSVQKVFNINCFSDHNLTGAEIRLPVKPVMKHKVVTNWRKFRLQEWNFTIPQKPLFALWPTDLNDEINTRILSTFKSTVGSKSISLSKGQAQSERLQKLKSRRANLWKKQKKSPSLWRHHKLRSLSKQIKWLIQSEHRSRIRSAIMCNQRNFWSCVKAELGNDYQSIPAIIKCGHQSLESREDQVEAFQKHFDNKVASLLEKQEVSGLSVQKVIFVPEYHIRVTPERIKLIQRQLKNSSSAGVDGVPVRLIKAETLAVDIAILLQRIVDTNCVPDSWKIAKIIPVFKKGDRSDMKNYRPVSILPSMSKIFEHVLLQEIIQQCELCNIDISGTFQHGFKKNSSTVTALMEISQLVAAALDNNKVVGAATLDLSAAFDIVDRRLLLQVLTDLGFTYSLVNLIDEWMTNRSSYVSIDECSSNLSSSESGVIQGSILGSILFTILIRGLSQVENVVAYADDLTVLVVGESEEQTKSELELKIEQTLQYLKQVGMVVNHEKTEVIFFHRSVIISKSVKVGDVLVQSKDHVKLLGVFLDSKLTWRKQSEAAISAASRAFGGIRVISKYFSNNEKIKLLKSHVYSRLYYAQEVWLHPSLPRSVMDRLNSFSGRVLSIACPTIASYEKRHQILSVQSPLSRAKYVTALCCHKLINRHLNQTELDNLLLNKISSPRCQAFQSVRNNNFKVGMNRVSNRAWHVKNTIPLSWFELSLTSFKRKVIEIFV
jgi:hypothetical protein